MLRFRLFSPKPILLSLLSIVLFIYTSDPVGQQAHAQKPLSLISSTSQGHVRQDVPSMQIYDFTMNDIDKKPHKLSEFKGKVMMVVNTASFCGNTPQYEDLQKLYERDRDQGFTILAFPANDFGQQEPGNNKEIAEFCYTKYSLEFPLFSKITVLGEQKHPLL